MADVDLGRRIRRAREAKRLHGEPWTQEHLAGLLGVSVRSIGRWEREGTVPRNSIGALEQVLGVDLGEDSDPGEQEYRARLEALRDDGFMTAGRVEDLLREYHERKHGPGARERTG